jgi:tetratricopeptide (TPR) repeat protein
VAVYVLKRFWPTGLEVLYAYPTHIPLWKPILTGVALCTVTVFVLRLRNCPWLAVGWLWYLVTLIPVIGIVQVGLQARADRYTYVPMVGVSIMIAFSGPVIFRRWPSVKPWAAYIAAAVTVLLGTMTWLQIGYWYSTQTLFRRAIDAAPQNYVALEYLAEELAAKESTLPEAIADYEAAIRIRPDFVQAHNGLGVTFFRMGLVPLAMTKYREAIRINPGYAEAHYDLGAALLSLGRNSEAIPEFRTALRINSSFAEAYNDLGAALLKMPGRLPEAIDNLQRALRINPEYSEAHNNLGLALTQDPRQLGTAIEHFKSAIRIKPRYADAWVNLGMALLRVPNHTHDAILTLEGALRIRPDAQLRRQLDRIEAAESAKGR